MRSTAETYLMALVQTEVKNSGCFFQLCNYSAPYKTRKTRKLPLACSHRVRDVLLIDTDFDMTGTTENMQSTQKIEGTP